MKELMDKIMSIDRCANNRLNEAIRKNEEAIREIDERKIKLSRQIKAYADEHLETFTESEMLTAQDGILAVKNTLDAEHERLKKIYDEKNERWVQQLVNKIIAV